MSSNEVAVRATTDGGGALSVRPDQIEWDPQQQAALAQIGVADAPRGDQLVLMHVSQRTGLDPFARQIYMVGRKDDEAPGGMRWTIQTGIDGFRVISERHPQYAGVGDAEWCGEDGVWRDVWVERKPPVAARYTVYRKDWDHPVRAVAHFAEYAQTKYNGDLVKKWRTSPALMIAKCAEALARRRACPQDLSAVYSDEEMDHADNPPPVIVQAEREAPAEPDWDALIAQHESAGDLAALGETWKLARGIRPNDSALLDRIAAAAERVKATQGEESSGPTGDTSAEKSQTKPTDESAAAQSDPADAASHLMGEMQKRRLFALLGEREIKSRDGRLRFANHALERDDLTSFGQLTANDASRLINQLEGLQRNSPAGPEQAPPPEEN